MVSVVPMTVARSYYEWEIENEGDHRGGCEPIVVFPKEEVGQDGKEWVRNFFAEMDEVRQTYPREAIELGSLVWDETAIDVGLI
jgi:hypothetical protein